MIYHCDRCRKKFEGDEGPGFTAGFYYVNEGYWSKYARPFETVLCDECMWNDPGYTADYGMHPMRRPVNAPVKVFHNFSQGGKTFPLDSDFPQSE